MNKHLLTNKHINYNKKENINNKEMIFDEHQLSFINNKIENCVVYGNPGCGKTSSIIEYCINKKVKSNEFLIISFSKKAQNDFINRGVKRLPIFNNNNTKTIHSLACTIMKKIYNKSSTNINTIILATLKAIINEDLSVINCLQKCKFIIVDEAQDINENQYNLINLISIKLNIALILVGDPNQNIYQFQGGDDNYLLNHSSKKFNLINNYRSTNQIIDFCNFIRPHENLPLMIGTNKNNNKPLLYCESINNILLHIKNELLNNEYKLHEIAIIGPVKLSKHDKFNTLKSIGLQLICNYLNENNIKFIKYYKDNNNDIFDNNDNIEIKHNHVNILTSHGSKGLEFKKVLVINYHLTTFSKKPSEKEYNNFKYLWYVTLTRAINKLIIYIDKDKYIFPEITKIPKDYYIHNGLEINKPKLNFPDNKIQQNFTIVDIINNNNFFNENVLYDFEQKFNFNIITNELYNIENNNILEFNKYSCLYGLFFEELFLFYYYKNNYTIQDYINKGIQKLNNIIIVSQKYINIINSLKDKGYIIKKNEQLLLYINNINKLNLKSNEYDFILYCKEKIINIDIPIILLFENNLYKYEQNKLIEMYNLLNNNVTQNVEKNIFDIVLYYYQIENECMHILNYDFNKNINSMKEYFNKINELSKNKNNFNFQVKTINNHININGIIDILHNNNIIELKFCKNINIKHILQVLLYNNNYYFKNNMEIWNLYDGKKYIIHFNSNIWDLNCYLCNILQIKMNNNIFILDIETNTINENIDFTEPNNTEIIDRYVYEYNFNIPVSDGLIKNSYKLTTTHINGITNDDLINSDININKFKEDMEKIMKYCNEPLLIAHNGKKFDFKILDYHNIINLNNILILDTLYLFGLFYKEKNISNKLINLYNKICNKNITQVHRAKEDTLLIVEILNKLNLSMNQIKSLINKNY
jgi:thymidine kinase